MAREMETVLSWKGGQEREDGDGEVDNEPPVEKDKIQHLNEALTEVTDKMKRNMEGILERGERLDGLSDIAMNLENSGKQFKKITKDVEKTYKKKNRKAKCIIALIVVILLVAIIIVIVLFATGIIPSPLTEGPTIAPITIKP